MDEAAGTGPVGGAGPVEQVLAAGTPQGIGWYRFWFAEQRWEWSDEVARMHGYEPGTITPTTELLLSHKHPEDRQRVLDTVAVTVRERVPFSSRHRIIDTGGREHHVIVVSDPITGAGGVVTGTGGYYIDITAGVARQRAETLDEYIPHLLDQRLVIEQAKGALMLAYSIGEQAAFDVLRWRSQETNTKLRDLATALVNALHGVSWFDPGARSAFDHLLLTIHQHTPGTGPEPARYPGSGT